MYAVWAGVCVLVRIDNIISIPLRCASKRETNPRQQTRNLISLERCLLASFVSPDETEHVITELGVACIYVALTHLVFMGWHF